MELINKIIAKQILPSWKFVASGLEKDFKFSNFNSAFGFITRVALLAEANNHHPELLNSFGNVKIRLTTQSHGGVTQLDIDLAKKIDTLLS